MVLGDVKIKRFTTIIVRDNSPLRPAVRLYYLGSSRQPLLRRSAERVRGEREVEPKPGSESVEVRMCILKRDISV